MKRANKYSFDSAIDLVMYTGRGRPTSIRLSIGRVINTGIVLAGIAFLTITGSLLFFREYEINRTLEAKLLLLQTATTGTQTPITPELDVEPEQTNTVHSQEIVSQPATPKVEEVPQPTTAASAEPAKQAIQTKTLSTHVDEFGIECDIESCMARLAMTSTGTSVAQGSLLIVLETEVPRIGASDPTAQPRKRYFIHPKQDSRDELDLNQLNKLNRANFKFSKFLQSTAQFTFGKLLAPLLVHLFVFDKDDNLVQHERRTVERRVQ